MNIRPIKTEADYERALADIERLWGAAENTPEGDRLDILLTLVEAYAPASLRLPAAGERQRWAAL